MPRSKRTKSTDLAVALDIPTVDELFPAPDPALEAFLATVPTAAELLPDLAEQVEGRKNSRGMA